MTSSRDNIINKLRLKTPAHQSEHPGTPPQPSLAKSADLTHRIKQKLEAVHTSVDIIDSIRDAEQSVITFLESHGCALKVGVHPEADIKLLALNKGVDFYRYDNLAKCESVLSFAPIAIAETGSVVMPSDIQRPTLANFLPDNCIILLNQSDIVAYLEDALINVKGSDADMPRALNLISGPSKTADIEQTLVYGAHGPIQLHVIILRND